MLKSYQLLSPTNSVWTSKTKTHLIFQIVFFPEVVLNMTNMSLTSDKQFVSLETLVLFSTRLKLVVFPNNSFLFLLRRNILGNGTKHRQQKQQPAVGILCIQFFFKNIAKPEDGPHVAYSWKLIWVHCRLWLEHFVCYGYRKIAAAADVPCCQKWTPIHKKTPKKSAVVSSHITFLQVISKTFYMK